VLDRAAHLRHQLFGRVNCKPASVVPAIQNVAAMLLGRQTSRAVFAPTPAAAKAVSRIADHKSAPRSPASESNRQATQLCESSPMGVTPHNHCKQNLQRKNARKPPFQRSVLPYATETSEADVLMNRRQILLAAAAGAAMTTRIPNAQAATYNLLTKGGGSLIRRSGSTPSAMWRLPPAGSCQSKPTSSAMLSTPSMRVGR
jgi:hypothetical protein